ncbi:Hint domain-containing protein [Tateyamaria omphalii]|uniref:Hint domain-containing protein n=1 Tax=Tateyamaria omphalii TaxID=299262 RepID=UPI001C99F7F9|nr:Hint domain-containing protein [Tateyamaria omphalii]MBY5931630.1 Hint domain-containing protein [Tateyamaria omphalii]
MPNGGSITGFLFQDFTFVNDNGQLNPGQNGPFSLPGNAQATLAGGASTIDINVLDDDMEFDDGFQDDPNGTPLNQILRDDINTTDAAGNPVQIAAGAVLEVEFTLTATPVGGGAPIDLLFVAAGPGENQGDLTLVVSTAPLVPGTTYDISFKNDGGGTPYGEIVCFARGTLIRTPAGDVPVETLGVGDRILTLDEGAQRITWAAQRMILFPQGDDLPVWVAPHTFGTDKPYAPTGLSPRHCVLQRNAAFRMMFDSAEVLVAARDCVDGDGITQGLEGKAIEYFHFMVDGHALVWANGMLTETFYPGPVARQSLDPIAHARLVALYPSLSDPAAPAPFPRARQRVRGYELRATTAAQGETSLTAR